jgi:hypothetical protein
MKIRFLIVLALTVLSVSACVVEPGGYRGGGYHGGYGGGYGGGHGDFLGNRDRDYGRRVWR